MTWPGILLLRKTHWSKMPAMEHSPSGSCELALRNAAASAACTADHVIEVTDNDAQPVTSAGDDEMLWCCVGRHLVDDPMQLRCLHHCCRSCLDAAAAAKDDSAMRLVCPKCYEVTDSRAAKSNAFLSSRVSMYKVLNEGRACTKCKDDGDYDRPAIVWCAACQSSFCDDCRKIHAQFFSKNKQHDAIPLEAVKSYEDLCATVPFKCAEHGQPAEIVCLTCSTSKCVHCWRRCSESNHNALHAQHATIESHASEVRRTIAELRDVLVNKSALLTEWRLQDSMRHARNYHVMQLQMRKRLIMDAVEVVYDEALRTLFDVCDIVEQRAFELDSLDVKVGQALSYSDFVLATESVHDLIHQQQQLTERLHLLSAEMDDWTALQNAASMITGPCALPSNYKEVVAELFGKPELNKGNTDGVLLKSQTEVAAVVVDPTVVHRYPEVKPNLVRHGYASNDEAHAFEVVLHCRDLAVTCDGKVLVGTCDEGLVEYSSSGKRISTWKPPVLSNGALDAVQTVEALPDGGAIVGLYNSKVVVMLDYCESSDDRWSEKFRFDCLLYNPLHLSVQGSVVAVAESEGHEQLLLLCLDSRQQLSRQKRGYNIEGVAVTFEAVVTASDKLSDGFSVIEAYPQRGGVRLWRHMTDVGIIVRDLCSAAAARRLLYIAEWKSSEGRMGDLAIIGTDGCGVRECGKVSLSGEKQSQLWQWMPRCLAVASGTGERLLLAVLCNNDSVFTFPVLLTAST